MPKAGAGPANIPRVSAKSAPPGNLPLADAPAPPVLAPPSHSLAAAEKGGMAQETGKEVLRKKEKKVEDIFASTDRAGKTPGTDRLQGQTISQGLADGSRFPIDSNKIKVMSPEQMVPGLEQEPLSSAKKAMIIAISIVLIAGLGLGGFFAYKRFFTAPTPAPTGELMPPAAEVTAPAEPPEPELPLESPVIPIPEEEITSPLPSPEESVGGLDNDGDGLTNDEEAALGTNFDDPDTDGDGLPDLDEVKVYKTDPLNPDTDADGYRDGEEVRNGYNPNGAGRLLNLP